MDDGQLVGGIGLPGKNTSQNVTQTAELSHSRAFGNLRNSESSAEAKCQRRAPCTVLSLEPTFESAASTQQPQGYDQWDNPLLDRGSTQALTVSSASFSSCWM